MKRPVTTVLSLCLMVPLSAEAQEAKPMLDANTLDTVRKVAPALEKYAHGPLADLWRRPGLGARDRSVVTVAAMVARNQTADFPGQLERALDNGVKPAEISEIITHLAFYSGWSNAMAATAAAKDVFDRRNIGRDRLAAVSPPLLALNEVQEANRANRVDQQFGATFSGVVQYTTDVLFRDLWLRPAFAPRDRSLVTISALVAAGQIAQLTAHLNLGMDNGLTQTEVAEAITHLAFYVGWPNVFSAMPVAKDVFEKRPR